jgi:hypothetical protein
MLGIGITVLFGLVATFLALRYRHRSPPDQHPPPKDIVHASRWWRSRGFRQALTYLTQYGDAVSETPETRESQRAITREDLYVWGSNVLLTAASRISRYSQGKANLFVVNEVFTRTTPPTVTLRSQQFVGAFPLLQLTTHRNGRVYNYRDMEVNATSTATVTVASTAVLHNRLLFDRIGDHVSDEERRLGTTHILAIPICDGIADIEPGDIAVITVDFRLPLRVRVLHPCGLWQSKRRIDKRAERLQTEARRFATLLPEGCAS